MVSQDSFCFANTVQKKEIYEDQYVTEPDSLQRQDMKGVFFVFVFFLRLGSSNSFKVTSYYEWRRAHFSWWIISFCYDLARWEGKQDKMTRCLTVKVEVILVLSYLKKTKKKRAEAKLQ